jgi:hypothetical protein
MTSIASLLPTRGLSPSANSRSSKTPAFVVLMVTATRAAIREPVRAELGVIEDEMGAGSEAELPATGAGVGRPDSTGSGNEASAFGSS